MSEHNTQTKVKRAWVEATIIRADGTREELGTIADTDFTFLGRLRDWLKRIFR